MEESKKSIFKSKWAMPLFWILLFAFLISSTLSSTIANLLAGLFSALTPIITAALIVFVLKHFIDHIEQKWLRNLWIGHKHEFAMKRTISLIISFVVLFVVFFLMIKLIVPRTIEIVTELFNNRESYIYQIRTQLTEFFEYTFSIGSSGTVDSIINGIAGYIENAFNDFLPQLLELSTTTLIFLAQIILGLFLALMYLKDKEKIAKFFHRCVELRTTKERGQEIFHTVEKSDKVLFDYFIAKLLEAGVILLGVGITLSILGIKFAFEMALIISILNFIPYIGIIFALIPASLITLIYGSVQATIEMIIIVVIVVNILTTFVTPFIIGKKIRTPVIVMLLAIVVGAGLFGMWGMVIAPPISAIIYEVVIDRMKKSKIEPTDSVQIGQDDPPALDEQKEVS